MKCKVCNYIERCNKLLWPNYLDGLYKHYGRNNFYLIPLVDLGAQFILKVTTNIRKMKSCLHSNFNQWMFSNRYLWSWRERKNKETQFAWCFHILNQGWPMTNMKTWKFVCILKFTHNPQKHWNNSFRWEMTIIVIIRPKEVLNVTRFISIFVVEVIAIDKGT